MASVTRWTWVDAILSQDGPKGATLRLTLLGLAKYMSRGGDSCFPSVATLAQATDLGERTIRRDLLEAIDLGWIERRHRNDNRRGRSYVYLPRVPDTTEQPADAEKAAPRAGNPPPEKRHHVPVMAPEKAAPRAGNGCVEKPEKRHHVPVKAGKAAPRAGLKRHHVPVYISNSEEQDRLPSLRSGAPDELGARINTNTDHRVKALLMEVAKQTDSWKRDHPANGGEVVGWWIELRIERPPEGEIAKQGRAASRLATRHTRSEVIRAMIGIQGLYPHSEREPWDLFDLERKFTKAFDAFMTHPEVERWRFRRGMQS